VKLKQLALALGLSCGVLAAAQFQDGGGDSAADPLAASPSTDSPDPAPPTAGSTAAGEWHFIVTPYLWFPGIHGTVGDFNREVGVHASAVDLLSHFRFGLMGTAEARRGPIVLPLDIFWVRLRDDGAKPFPNIPASSADFKADLFILTPKVGLRLLSEEKVKCDVLAGFRYWHFNQDVAFRSTPVNLNFSRSQDLVDPVVGTRIETDLSKKFVMTLAGDVGGWGTGSTLEYQLVGILGYRIKENWTLQAGYRYLSLDWSRGGANQAIFDVALSGVALGVTINLK
jgi:hypothetical protein